SAEGRDLPVAPGRGLAARHLRHEASWGDAQRGRQRHQVRAVGYVEQEKPIGVDRIQSSPRSSSYLRDGSSMKKTMLLCGTFLLLTSRPPGQPGNPTPWGDAGWVGHEADPNRVPKNNEPRSLRRPFELTTAPKPAELWITADNLYIAHVN